MSDPKFVVEKQNHMTVLKFNDEFYFFFRF